MLYYLGIDVGKFSHSLCLLTKEGKKTIFQIDNNREGFEKLKTKLSELDCENILIGMEATGHYFLNLYDWLLQCSVATEQIALLNPLQVKSFRNTNLRGAKSDNVDSERIAILLKFGEFKRCNVVVDEMMNLRELTRLRADLVANIGSLKRKMISVMDRIFPEFMKIFSNRFGKTVMGLLDNYTPEEMAELSLDELTKAVKDLSTGRGRGISKRKIQALYEASQNSIGITFGKEAFKIELDILLIRLKVLQQQVDRLENEIQLIVKKNDSKIFTIPGIGMTTGATILSEVGNIQNFPSAVKLIAFSGLDPKLKESGNYQGKTPISKRGSKYLRGAIWYSAMVTCRVDPKFKKFYDDRRDKGKSHRYAVTAAANKLTKVIYHILKNDCSFNPDLV